MMYVCIKLSSFTTGYCVQIDAYFPADSCYKTYTYAHKYPQQQ